MAKMTAIILTALLLAGCSSTTDKTSDRYPVDRFVDPVTEKAVDL